MKYNCNSRDKTCLTKGVIFVFDEDDVEVLAVIDGGAAVRGANFASSMYWDLHLVYVEMKRAEKGSNYLLVLDSPLLVVEFLLWLTNELLIERRNCE